MGIAVSVYVLALVKRRMRMHKRSTVKVNMNGYFRSVRRFWTEIAIVEIFCLSHVYMDEKQVLEEREP